MPNLIIDDTLRAKLHGLQEPVKLLDEAGRSLGCFVPEAEYKQMLYAWVESQCPYSEEELEKFSQETGGKPLSEIWKELGAK